MSTKYSSALSDYLPAFENSSEPLLFYYSLDKDKTVLANELTRGQFWSLAKKAGSVIRKSCCKRGDCFAHCFGANHYYDLLLRLAATMTGTIPVTINWQADTIDQIFYKIELTECKLVVTDSHFNTEHRDSIKNRFPTLPISHVDHFGRHEDIREDEFAHDIDPEFTRIIVFTSGTTGQPKGVQLPYRAYQTNRSTFEQFLEINPEDRFAVLVVNPLHHANSTALTDWAMRRPGSQIHLIERYSSDYWKILTDVVLRDYDRIVAPTVSRHFDFLENLDAQNNLPIELEGLKGAMEKTDFLIGSAPVGPTTIKRVQHYAGRIPNVRFGSTETCLQVIGIPRHLSEEIKLRLFQKGWNHQVKGEAYPGYFIGRPHPPYTEARIVKSITPDDKGYMKDCEMSQPGYLITRGGNLMSGYVRDEEETRKVFHDGWYTGLKDICFVLMNEEDGEKDYYWVSRESTLLIRGGVNYSYDQINSELMDFVSNQYGLTRDSFDIAVVGLKVDSEHEDSCCVAFEMRDEQARNKMEEIEKTFKDRAKQHVSKGARPDYVLFGQIPRNFKGSVLVKELTAQFKQKLGLKS